MILNILKYYISFVPKLARFPLLVLFVSIPFILGAIFFETGSLLHPYHLLSIGTIIAVQIWYSRRSFNTCGTCGHERHMHDKRDLVTRGFETLTQIVCDDFRRGIRDPRNYNRVYWNGEDTTKKWDKMRDR